jgi:hypothetical protein
MPVPICPGETRFPIFRAFTDAEISQLKTIVNLAEYRKVRADNVDYYVIAYLEEKLHADKSDVAMSVLKAAWQAENDKSPDEARYLEEARLRFTELARVLRPTDKKWLTAGFLSSELARRLGHFDDADTALAAFEKAAAKNEIEIPGTLAEQERAFIANRDSAPHEIDPRKKKRAPLPIDGLDMAGRPLTTLHSFEGERGGGYLVVGPDGAFYGTANGDFHECSTGAGCGSIFKLTPPATASDRWDFKTLYLFRGGAEGANPSALVFGPDGALYGVTSHGGITTSLGWSGAGRVFRFALNAAKDEPALTTIYDFHGEADGANPEAGLAFDRTGAIYGTSWAGEQPFKDGSHDFRGKIFRLTPPTNDKVEWVYTVLQRTPDQVPNARILIDASGALYGAGATIGQDGQVYRLEPPTPPSGEWRQSILHIFTGANGSEPAGPLIMDAKGAIYGTTARGGVGGCWKGCGTVFKLMPPESDQGDWRAVTLYAFSDQDHGLTQPEYGVTLGKDGALYGTAIIGGKTTDNAEGKGGIFKLTPPPSGDGPWTETTLHVFREDTNDGEMPRTGLLIDDADTLYGTTANGGLSHSGTVFKVRQR